MSQVAPSGPDFICIGANKGGTTWLHVNLQHHPDIWIPPQKELHYFDRSLNYPSPSMLACSRSLLKRFIGTDRANKKYRESLVRSIGSLSKDFSWESLKWYYSFFFGEHNDQWYLSLFRDCDSPVKGEITPAYSMLYEADIEKVYNLVPNTKIIFLLRDPIERTWSEVRHRQKRFRKYRHLTSLSTKELIEVINEPGFELRSDYTRTLRLWKKYFPENRIFVGFYDELKEKPTDLLIRVFEFLGVEPSSAYIPDSVSQRVNVSPKKNIPDELYHYLAAKYHPMISELSEEFGGYAKVWLEELDGIVSTSVSVGN